MVSFFAIYSYALSGFLGVICTLMTVYMVITGTILSSAGYFAEVYPKIIIGFNDYTKAGLIQWLEDNHGNGQEPNGGSLTFIRIRQHPEISDMRIL